MKNMPEIKLAVVGVSRDCFPIALTKSRLAALMGEVKKSKLTNVVVCPVVIENEVDAMKAVVWCRENGVNAACMFLGNFGPEGPTTFFVEKFGLPSMVLAAKEESKKGLASDRGDALCGVLNFSYNVGLRRLRVYIPEFPNVTAKEAVKELAKFKNGSLAREKVRSMTEVDYSFFDEGAFEEVEKAQGNVPARERTGGEAYVSSQTAKLGGAILAARACV